jgi:hypothetical protein
MMLSANRAFRPGWGSNEAWWPSWRVRALSGRFVRAHSDLFVVKASKRDFLEVGIVTSRVTEGSESVIADQSQRYTAAAAAT